MRTRVATKDDVRLIQELNDKSFGNNYYVYDSDLIKNWAWSEKCKQYFLEALNNPKAICLIAEQDNKPVGFLIAEPKDFSYRLSKYIEIGNMGVLPDFSSRGIGTQLINECTKIAQSKGYQKIYVNAYIDNTRAIAFYEKCGLKKIDISLEKNI